MMIAAANPSTWMVNVITDGLEPLEPFGARINVGLFVCCVGSPTTDQSSYQTSIRG